MDPEKRRKQEDAWSDSSMPIPDRDGQWDDTDDANEPVYRDGTVRHECAPEET